MLQVEDDSPVRPDLSSILKIRYEHKHWHAGLYVRVRCRSHSSALICRRLLLEVGLAVTSMPSQSGLYEGPHTQVCSIVLVAMFIYHEYIPFPGA